MTKNEAINEALDSLGSAADETYEGDELNDPEIKDWIQKKNDAIAVLRGMQD